MKLNVPPDPRVSPLWGESSVLTVLLVDDARVPLSWLRGHSHHIRPLVGAPSRPPHPNVSLPSKMKYL